MTSVISRCYRSTGWKMMVLAVVIFSFFPNQIKAYTQSEIGCLALNIYHEARGESVKGQIAVAGVTLNRVASSRYPATVCEVVWQPKQFSWTNTTGPVYPTDMKAWREVMNIAKRVYYSRGFNQPIGDATHYHSVRVNPRWASKLEFVTRVGGHLFYIEA